jgi:GNAT superfamily N-acetyltransferase
MINRDLIDSGFLYSTSKEKLDIGYIHRFLSEDSYWAKNVPIDIVRTSIENSLSFGVYDLAKGTRQCGFARLVTDYATFAYLGDVFVDPQYRGRGLSKTLMSFIFGLEELKMFRRLMLATADAHSLYSKFGFRPLKNPDRFMELHNPDVYKNL